MATSLKIPGDVNEIMDKVKELRSSNLRQGIDFDFKFHPTRWDNFSYEPAVDRHAEFIFYNEKAAVLYALKWIQ